MIAVVIRAGRLLEHVMRLAALSPDINPEYLSGFCVEQQQFLLTKKIKNKKPFQTKVLCITKTFYFATDGYETQKKKKSLFVI